jgi:cytidine deaminase
MTKLEFLLNVEEYDSINELNDDDAWLLTGAREVTQFAYAPYSNFYVGVIAKRKW